MKSAADVVRAFPFFARLDEETLAELLAVAQTRTYEKDAILFLQDEPCKGLFLVQAGLIKIFKTAENGREQILHIQRPGDALAELPLFDHGPYPASASAMEDAAVLFIPRAAFEEVLARHPQLCHSIITVLAKRLRKMVGLVEDLSLRQVRQRLARLLIEEADGERAFRLTYTNEELAARLGSVRDVISRTLSAMQADGLILLKGRQVEILRPEALQETAGL